MYPQKRGLLYCFLCLLLFSFLLPSSEAVGQKRKKTRLMKKEEVTMVRGLAGTFSLYSFRSRSLERLSSGGYGMPDIFMSYPEFGRADIDEDIAHWLKQLATTFEETVSITAEGSTSLTCSYDVFQASHAAVSIRFELWMHTGTSQPNQDILAVNYSWLSGKRLSTMDIFEDPEKAISIMSLVSREVLRKKVGGGRLTEAILAGTMPVIENFSHFVLTRQGIRVFFQTYQVASGEAGAQFVDIPLKKFSPAKPLLCFWGF